MKRQNIGYARVSSIDQKLSVQLDKLQECDKIFQEKVSGTSTKRPQLQACLDYVREGDILVVTRLDRLARSTLDLCKAADFLQSKKVHLKVIDQNIDTSHATGRLLFHMLAAIAQFETEIRSERQREGILKAKERGTAFGRKQSLSATKIKELSAKRKQGTLIKDLMQDYNLSKASVYRYLKTSQPSIEYSPVINPIYK